jgi:putative molybdopterin biosynthesis protein
MPRLQSRVAELRQQRGLRQQALAAAAGVSRQALSAIEAGKATPSTDVALRLGRALDCRVEDLFALDDDERITAELAGDAATPRVALAAIDGRWIAHPLGAAATAADGLVAAGSRARRSVRLLAPASALRDRLLVAGCAPALGVLAARAAAERGGPRITWLERSSADALALLACGQIHVAGVHLDGGDGAGNLAAVRRGVPGRALRLFRLARWSAGLVVAAGNPRRIAGVRDLGRVRVVRRDAGAGAEVLLARLTADAGVAPRSAGPRATSHLAVAQAVALGAADTGVAVESVARALGLGFVPLAEERFDLVVAADVADDPRLVRLLATLAGRPFRRDLEGFAGHRATDTGDLVAEIAGTA